MKHLNKILIAFAIIMGLNATAQDSKDKWAVSFGVNALDTKTSAGGGNNWLDGHLSQAFSVKDNWNILPAISYVGVSRYVGDNFSVGISGSINKLTKFVTASKGDYIVTNPGDLKYFGIEGLVKYSFKTAIKSKIIIVLFLKRSNLRNLSSKTVFFTKFPCNQNYRTSLGLIFRRWILNNFDRFNIGYSQSIQITHSYFLIVDIN